MSDLRNIRMHGIIINRNGDFVAFVAHSPLLKTTITLYYNGTRQNDCIMKESWRV